MANWFITQPAKRDLMEIVESISDYTGYVNSGIKLYQELTAFFDKVAFMPFGLGTEIDNGL